MASYNSATTQEIYEQVKHDILTLKLLPGQLISENELANSFQVSRSPVRTVISMLKNDKLVEVVPQKGSFVSLLDMEYIEAIIYMRYTAEKDVLKQVAQKADSAFFARLEENLAIQKTLAEGPTDTEAFYQTDEAFHSLCFSLAGQERVWQIIKTFQAYYSRFRMLDIVTFRRFYELYNDHLQLYNLLKANDISGIDKALKAHLYSNVEKLRPKIEQELKAYFR